MKSVRHCVICKKVEGVRYGQPTTPELQEFRVSDAPRFSHTELDFVGPLYVKDMSKETSSNSQAGLNKVYVLLLTSRRARTPENSAIYLSVKISKCPPKISKWPPMGGAMTP